MTITLEQFREAVAERRGDGRKRGAHRYDEAVTAFAVQHAQSLVASGLSVHAAAKALGISMMTLQSWIRRAEPVPHANKVRTVIVSEAQPSAATTHTITVTTSTGHIVRGLDVEQAAALLKALS
jgi:hypothetical protein